MKLYKKLWFVPVLCLLISSCYDDEGNYDYHELDELEITNIPEEISVLAYAEYIQINPVIKSKKEGEIKGDNPNYSFTYLYDKIWDTPEGTNECTVLDSAFTKDMNLLAELKAKRYKCWFQVKDNRTGIVATKPFTLTVASTNYEGWMVLCNEGPEKRVRLDMIGVISADREVVTYDILPDLPLIHRSTRIGFDANFFSYDGASIRIMSEEGGYKLEPDGFETGPEYSMDYEFGDSKVHHAPLVMYIANGKKIIVDKESNAYLQGTSTGAIFGRPINTLNLAETPQFKVSPYLGVATANSMPGALLFDSTNKRFLMWYTFAEETCMELPQPDPKLFDYQIGMDLVYMGCIENNNEIYALLKNEQGKYCLCGIQMIARYPPVFKQILYHENLDADRIAEATHFALHPNLPYLFYSVKNEIWQYDYSTKQTKRMPLLGDNEEVTMLKFNMYRGFYGSVEKPDEYFERQYDLIVGSVDTQAEGINNGKLRFYKVPRLNENIQLKGEPYTGFAEIVDVVYRERE